MQSLTLAQLEVLGISVEVCLEVGYRLLVGMLVVYAESTAHVDVFHFDVVLFQFVLEFVDAVAQGAEVSHVEYLAAYVEAETNELYVLHILGLLYDGVHITHGNAELVLCQTCGDVGVCMCTDVRIDA